MKSSILNTITTLLRRTLKSENLISCPQKVSLVLVNGESSYHHIFKNRWLMHLDESKTLEIEFLEELGDTEIHLKNQFGDILYELQIFTVPLLHIIIDVSDWNPGIYSIEINNPIEKEKASLFHIPVMYLLILGKYPSKKTKHELTAM